MKLNQFHRIIRPVYYHFIAVIFYFPLRTIGDFIFTIWNTVLFYFLLAIAPVLVFALIFKKFRAEIVQHNYSASFLVFMTTGIPPGVFLGYGLWEMAHGSPLWYLGLIIMIYSLVTACLFGVVGVALNFVVKRK